MNMTAYEPTWSTSYYEELAVPLKPNIIHPVESTQELLIEFEKVYNTLQYTHLSPQLPMQPAFKVMPSQQQCVNNNNNYSVPVPATVPTPFNNVSNAQDAFVVDEIVRTRCQDLTIDAADPWHDENTSSSSSYSSGLSPRSESDSCYGGSAFSEDDSGGSSGGGSGYRRPKPYDRPQDEKKSRKKEQNKNAATRYRQKKKQEVEEILVEEKALSDVNEKLEKNFEEVKREVKYLKNLMRELFKSNGLLD